MWPFNSTRLARFDDVSGLFRSQAEHLIRAQESIINQLQKDLTFQREETVNAYNRQVSFRAVSRDFELNGKLRQVIVDKAAERLAPFLRDQFMDALYQLKMPRAGRAPDRAGPLASIAADEVSEGFLHVDIQVPAMSTRFMVNNNGSPSRR
jgi:hypothetical protein